MRQPWGDTPQHATPATNLFAKESTEDADGRIEKSRLLFLRLHFRSHMRRHADMHRLFRLGEREEFSPDSLSLGFDAFRLAFVELAPAAAVADVAGVSSLPRDVHQAPAEFTASDLKRNLPFIDEIHYIPERANKISAEIVDLHQWLLGVNPTGICK